MTNTQKEYDNLLRKVHSLEGIVATLEYRNHMLQGQVDTNSGEGQFKDYKNLAECMKDQIADDPKHDPVAAVWIANQPTRKLLSERQADFTRVNPTGNTGTDINQNSKIYSRYITDVQRPTWREKKFDGPAITETKQDTS